MRCLGLQNQIERPEKHITILINVIEYKYELAKKIGINIWQLLK